MATCLQAAPDDERFMTVNNVFSWSNQVAAAYIGQLDVAPAVMNIGVLWIGEFMLYLISDEDM